MKDIPLSVQKRATELYMSGHYTLKQAYDAAFLEEGMKKSGLPTDELFGGIFGRCRK